LKGTIYLKRVVHVCVGGRGVGERALSFLIDWPGKMG